MTRWIEPDADGVLRFAGHPDEIGRGPSFEIAATVERRDRRAA